jgi:hypothetical protein
VSLYESTILAQIRGGLTRGTILENSYISTNITPGLTGALQIYFTRVEDERSDGYGHNMAKRQQIALLRFDFSQQQQASGAAHSRNLSRRRRRPFQAAPCGRRLRHIFFDRRCGHPLPTPSRHLLEQRERVPRSGNFHLAADRHKHFHHAVDSCAVSGASPFPCALFCNASLCDTTP